MRALPIALSVALLVAPAQVGPPAPAAVPVVAAVDSGPFLDPAPPEPPPAAVEAAAAAPAPQTAPPAHPAPAPAPGATTVVASWYGPGLWANRTACGQILTPELLGVAHRTLPCGTLVTLRHAGAMVTAPVVDNGPHVPGREFDLTYRARLALGCPDLCFVGWVR